MYPVRAVDQRITRYSFSPMRLKIHSAVRVWFSISRQVTRDTLGAPYSSRPEAGNNRSGEVPTSMLNVALVSSIKPRSGFAFRRRP
jgi:hypothetical protein